MVMNFLQFPDTFESRHSHPRVLVAIGSQGHRLSLEAMFVVPGQSDRVRTLDNRLGRVNPLSVKGVVVSAIFIFFPNTPADFEVEIRCHGYIAGIE